MKLLSTLGVAGAVGIAVAMGGGGHHNASGFTFHGSLEGAIAEVRNRLP